MKKLTLFLLGLISTFGAVAQEERTTGYVLDPYNPNTRIVSSRPVAQNTVLANRAEATSRRDNIAPTISISSPATNASYVVGTNVAISISASDNVGVTRVDLKVNNVTKYTKTAAPWTFTWSTTGLTAASYTITATAYDAAGNNKTSTAITIKLTTAPIVTTDTVKPSFYSPVRPVANTSPTTGTIAYAGVPDTFSVGVIENVQLASVKWYVNGVLKATQPGFTYPTQLAAYYYVFIPDTVIVYRPYSQPTSATITATATDAAGNTATSSYVRTIAVIYRDTTRYASKYTLACPPVINQGGEGSCASQSSTYYARSITQYYKTGASSYSYSTNIFSPEFTFDYAHLNTTTPNECSGSGIQYNFDLLQTKGACLFSTLPYSSYPQPGCQQNSTNIYSRNCDSCIITDAMRAEAANYKIKEYVKLYVSDTALMKYFLARNHPIVITIAVPVPEWDDNGAVRDTNYVLKCSTWAGCTSQAHAITVVGWDDNRQAFKIINSFGSTWGSSGYAWIGYQLFTAAYNGTGGCSNICSYNNLTTPTLVSLTGYIMDPFEY